MGGYRGDEVTETGAVVVSGTVARILVALASDLDGQLDALRDGKGDPLAAIEETVSLLVLLASGSWGEGTVESEDEDCAVPRCAECDSPTHTVFEHERWR